MNEASSGAFQAWVRRQLGLATHREMTREEAERYVRERDEERQQAPSMNRLIRRALGHERGR